MMAPSDCGCDDNDDGRQEKWFPMMRTWTRIFCACTHRDVRTFYGLPITCIATIQKAAPISRIQFTDCVCKVDGPLINYFRSSFIWHTDTIYLRGQLARCSKSGRNSITSIHVTTSTVWIIWARTILTQAIMTNSIGSYLAMELVLEEIAFKWDDVYGWKIECCRSHWVLSRWWVMQVRIRFWGASYRKLNYLDHTTFISLKVSRSLN